MPLFKMWSEHLDIHTCIHILHVSVLKDSARDKWTKQHADYISDFILKLYS